MNNKELLEKLDNDVIEALKSLATATTDLKVGEALSQLVYLYNFNPMNLELMNTTIDNCEEYGENINPSELELVATECKYYSTWCNDDIYEAMNEVLADCKLDKKMDW